MKKFGFPLLVLAIIGLMVGVFIVGNKKAPKKVEDPNKKLLGTQYPNQGQTHIQPGAQHEAYNSNPPSSGSHLPAPAPWGIKDTAEADERYVHNLEHGGVWIAYKPDLPQRDIDSLKHIFENLPPEDQSNEVKAIMTPRAANDHAIALVAWTYVYYLDSPDEAKIKQFYEEHVNKGPELVP